MAATSVGATRPEQISILLKTPALRRCEKTATKMTVVLTEDRESVTETKH